MATKDLSPREEEIVSLCVEGLTNEAIAHRLGISVGTVNTYWLRIKLKVGGAGKTDTVVRVIKERAKRALRNPDASAETHAASPATRERSDFELRATLAMFHFAMSHFSTTVWAADSDLLIYLLANGEFPSTHFGVTWEVGKTVYEIFKTTDPTDLAIAAHLRALSGVESELTLVGEFKSMFLRVGPLADEAGNVVGSISMLIVAGP